MTEIRKFKHIIVCCITISFSINLHAQFLTTEQVRNDFKKLLKRPSVSPSPSIESFPTDSVIIQRGYFYSEANEKVPLLIYKPISKTSKKFPVVICLHGTGGNKDTDVIRDLLNRFSKLGYMAIGMDGRFAGERGKSNPGQNAYEQAIIKAWKSTDTKTKQFPFLYDTVYDLWKLIDYLVTRTDVDSTRIGMMGISKGGIETWMAASVDTRIKVAVPVIAAQSFQWSLDNNRWQGRARTIWSAHVAAAKDLGDTGVTKENVKTFWDKLVPGITGEFDCPSLIRLIAPRPLLLLSTELDQNCPLPGARISFAAAEKAYKSKNASDKFSFNVQPGEPHRFTPEHLAMAVDWFMKWL